MGTPVRRTVVNRVLDSVQALALCHNVTPVYDDESSEETSLQVEADQQSQQKVVYQASSPDEVSSDCYLLIMYTNGFQLSIVKHTCIADHGHLAFEECF